jgi:hypothetical protein
MISARNAANDPLLFGMLIVDVSEVKLPGEAKQNNLAPECGQPIDGVKMKIGLAQNKLP